MTMSSHRTIVLQDQTPPAKRLRVQNKLALQYHNDRVIDETYFLSFFWSYYNDVQRLAANRLTEDYEEHGTAECRTCARHVVACAPYYSRAAGECYRCFLSKHLNSEYEMSMKDPARDPFLTTLFENYDAFYQERELELRGKNPQTAAVVVRSKLQVNANEHVTFRYALCEHCTHISPEDNVFVKTVNGLHWYHEACGECYTLEELKLIPAFSRLEWETLLNKNS
jgi:hypothetical protein